MTAGRGGEKRRKQIFPHLPTCEASGDPERKVGTGMT